MTLAILFSLTILFSLAMGEDCWTDQSFSRHRSNHEYSSDDAKQDFPGATGPFKMIADDGKGDSSLTRINDNAIRGSFRKGKILGYDTGFTFYSMNPSEADEASMSYSVKFSSGFDWTRGGKLPGLCGGDSPDRSSACPVGCSDVDKDRGFSTRLMWRSKGNVVTYAYYPDKPKSIRCGEDWVWSDSLKAGKWHDIRMWIKLNTNGNANGEFKSWLDGKQVLHKKRIRFRYRDDYKVSRTYITTYCGGSSVSMFAPKQDQYIWFDNFKSWPGDAESCGSPHSTASEKSASSKVSSKKSVGPMKAPTNINGYNLVRGQAGWDVSGHYEKAKPSRGSLLDNIKFCIKRCNQDKPCAGFTLYGGICWLKADVSKKATFKGSTSQGWRWYYLK